MHQAESLFFCSQPSRFWPLSSRVCSLGRGTSGVLVITPTRGLIDARTRIRLDDLREFAEVDIHESDPRYRLPI